jgi:DNA invertase Pin-like site-specific DNA recombinase
MYEDIKTACLYVRYSSTSQTEQSIEGQTRVCKEFCERNNIRIVEIYADRATSASKDIEKRVNFLRMIKDSEKHNFDAVIVYKLDRFSRSRYDSANYKYKLKKNGVQLISATENISDDPEGIILESVLEGMAEFYSAELSQKINRGLRESAYKHNSIGGVIPLGYKTENKKLVIDENSAPIVREAFSMFAEGHTIADICRVFNAKGYKSSKGARFSKSSFSKILRNEKYIGVYKFREYRAENAIPAIIDMDTWNRVQERLATNYKSPPGTYKAKRVYLLSGKLFCGHCGCKMNASCNAQGYNYYICIGRKEMTRDCTKKNLRSEFIEGVVARDALSLLTDERIEEIATIAASANKADVESSTDITALKGRLHETQVSLNNLLKAIESGLAPDTLIKRMAELEKDKKAIEAEIRNEERGVIFLDKEQVIFWLEQFKEGDIEDDDFKRVLIDLFVNSVTVWDEPDGFFKITIAYNLTSLKAKTYHLNKDGRSESDLESNPGALESNPIILQSGSILLKSLVIKEPKKYARYNHLFER